MRTADKPGTFRIFPKNGAFVLSGVHTNGERVKVRGLSHDEATAMGAKLFPRDALPSLAPNPTETPALDDFGLPPLRVSSSVVGSVGTPTGTPAPGPTPVVPTEADKAKKAKHAQSLMEMAGVGWAAGTVFTARRLAERVGKEPVKPNPKQVNNLADSTKDTLTEWFGDREIKPWQMTILLTIGIIVSMLIQSPKKKLESVKDAPNTTPLRSAEPLPPGAQNPPPAPLRSV